jgi:hypothetical protein
MFRWNIFDAAKTIVESFTLRRHSGSLRPSEIGRLRSLFRWLLYQLPARQLRSLPFPVPLMRHITVPLDAFLFLFFSADLAWMLRI